MPEFRENTSDENIWNNIVGDNNEYRLPDDMAGWTVIDVGAHIGAFTHACLERGVRMVYAFEPYPENYIQFEKNIGLNNKRVIIFPEAMWMSNIEHSHLGISGYSPEGEGLNTGSPSLVKGEAVARVDTVGLDDILCLYSDIDLLKLDCEGSEWPILFTSKRLYTIKRIIGEYHEFEFLLSRKQKIAVESAMRILWPKSCIDQLQPRIESLVEFLTEQGFEVDHFRYEGTELGMFFAERAGEE